jgi:hypothetical protein
LWLGFGGVRSTSRPVFLCPQNITAEHEKQQQRIINAVSFDARSRIIKAYKNKQPIMGKLREY